MNWRIKKHAKVVLFIQTAKQKGKGGAQMAKNQVILSFFLGFKRHYISKLAP